VRSVAVGIFCKTPMAGQSKTRLSPPLTPAECAELSASFIRDLAATIDGLARDAGVQPYAIFTPIGTEDTLRSLLPTRFRLLPQSTGDLGSRLLNTTVELLSAGHAGAILVNADSPTLPRAILSAAVDAVRGADGVVLGPAMDGGYTLIGLSRAHAHLFEDIPWSTSQVYRLTAARAADLGLPVVSVPRWYDVDDRESLDLLQAELRGETLPFAEPGLYGEPAAVTRRFLARRNAPLPVETGR